MPEFPSEAVERVAPTASLSKVDENLGELSSVAVGDQVVTVEAAAAATAEEQGDAGERDIDDGVNGASERQPSVKVEVEVDVGVEDDRPAKVEVSGRGTMERCFPGWLPVLVCLSGLSVCLSFGSVR